MEYGLGQEAKVLGHDTIIRLNPCCNGIWSRTAFNKQSLT